ncbi:MULTISPECIES: MFS transporter [Paenibacillus]|uniref:MFS transporter n=1 Tax=Paenibacillus lautus TaxID=1401 RepID=A0A1R1ANC7_PAELA|nr:MFS transporter [Paenibacillus lautus]OME87053.1 MFS transporter [Paenibacillus lautus]
MGTSTAIEAKLGKLWNKNYIMLLAIGALSYLAFTLASPLIANYAVELGASVSLAGVIVGIFAITALFVGPFGGILTDRTNKKYVMIVATVINGIATLGYSIAPNVEVMIFFRMLHGASISVTNVIILAWTTDFIPKKKMGEGIGYFGISQILATAIGPAIGISSSSHLGTSITFVFAASLYILAALCMFFVSNIKQESSENKAATKSKIGLKDIIAFQILPLSFIAALFQMGNGLASSYMVLLGENRNISGVSIYFIVFALMLLFTRPLSGKLYDKKGLKIILYPALLCGCAEALILGHAYAIWMIILAAVITSFGQGTALPSIQAESIRIIGSERKGLASSTYFIGANIGQGFGPLIGGAIATSFGYSGMFNFSAALMLCGILGYAIYNKKIGSVKI